MPDECKHIDFNLKEDRTPIEVEEDYPLLDYSAIALEYLRTHKENRPDGQPNQ